MGFEFQHLGFVNKALGWVQTGIMTIMGVEIVDVVIVDGIVIHVHIHVIMKVHIEVVIGVIGVIGTIIKTKELGMVLVLLILL